ncbi:hypothetical protein CDAR_396691 [Caerostris darwini]|uniref:Uncharacterized protein n=1 Tax=Caerostris darwini TaxID=1538125 RepID=A0AAV4PQS9_9ARAC|nr:hypothetical protein CDAR_396691 [Caerostris darwini]
MPTRVVQLTSSATPKAPQRRMKAPMYSESLHRNIVLKSPQGVPGNSRRKLPPGCSWGNPDETVRNGRYHCVVPFT